MILVFPKSHPKIKLQSAERNVCACVCQLVISPQRVNLECLQGLSTLGLSSCRSFSAVRHPQQLNGSKPRHWQWAENTGFGVVTARREILPQGSRINVKEYPHTPKQPNTSRHKETTRGYTQERETRVGQRIPNVCITGHCRGSRWCGVHPDPPRCHSYYVGDSPRVSLVQCRYDVM